MQIGKTAPSANSILHHSPEAFNGVEVVPTMRESAVDYLVDEIRQLPLKSS